MTNEAVPTPARGTILELAKSYIMRADDCGGLARAVLAVFGGESTVSAPGSSSTGASGTGGGAFVFAGGLAGDAFETVHRLTLASPANKQEAPQSRKPHEKTSWTCALATATPEGLKCPVANRCADCPAQSREAAPSDAEEWKRRALQGLMSDISEECYCAGWMSGNEYTLWEMVIDPKASRRYGMGQVSEEWIADLKAMSVEVGGWFRWVDDDTIPCLPVEEWGCKFTPLAEWEPIYERQMKEWAELRASIPPTPNKED